MPSTTEITFDRQQLASIGERFLTDQPLVSAGLFITASVPLILLAFASKYIMQGLQVGVSR